MAQPGSLKISNPDRRRKSTLERVRAHRERARNCEYGPPASLSRRRRLENSPEKWLRYYLAESFPLPFSSVHRAYLSDLEYIMKHGGWKATALPRGSGKTTIAKGFALLSCLTGASAYLFLVSATGAQAKQNLDSIKSWLQHSDRLAADYPEVVAPIRFTRGIPQAMKSITANGHPVDMRWTDKGVMLPGLPRIDKSGDEHGSAGAYAIIECDGITGTLRGRNAVIPTGQTVRPQFVIVDDPQTPESARSAEQCRQRRQLITSDIANMGGPGCDVRIVVPCTIIEYGDLADQLTDADQMPDFLGQRHPFFLSMPSRMDAWDEYNVVRVEGLANRDGGLAAIRYYREHHDELTAGAEVIWPERYGEGAVDGIQWGMNQYYKLGPVSFATELQNQPMPPQQLIRLTAAHVLACETKTPQWVIPFERHLFTCAFVDCNPRTSGLHWAVVTFGERLAAHIVAYGRYPARGKMVPEGASETEEVALLFEGLRRVCGGFADHRLTTATGAAAKIDMVLVDGGYQWVTVQMFVQQGRFPFRLAASRGRAATAYRDAGRDVIQAKTNVYVGKNARGERVLTHNACALRELAQRAFQAGPDAPGGIGIHASPPVHDEFAEQITSKILTDKGQGVTGAPMYRWNLRPGGQDHWLDCVVGCYAGAHYEGIDTAGEYSQRVATKRRRGLRQVQI